MDASVTIGGNSLGLGPVDPPHLSVVVPAFNAEDTLEETLNAVLAQTYTAWECIVVDDGSTDATREIAASFCSRDSRFSLVMQENMGTAGAYNTGVHAAAGAWISVCSSDDILLPRHLDVMADAINRRPDCSIITCNGYFLRPDGTRELCYDQTDGAERSWTLEELIARCFFSVGACYRSELRDRLGGYRTDSYTEDYDFWLRAMAAGARHLYIPAALAVHRISESQKSSSLRRVFESDIRSIRSLVKSGGLTAAQARSARLAIRERQGLIADLEGPGFLTRVRQLLDAARTRIGIR